MKRLPPGLAAAAAAILLAASRSRAPPTRSRRRAVPRFLRRWDPNPCGSRRACRSHARRHSFIHGSVFPEGGDVHRPVILIRTPYGKQGWRQGNPRAALAAMLATNGYIVAIQDKRAASNLRGATRSPSMRTSTATIRSNGYPADVVERQSGHLRMLGLGRCAGVAGAKPSAGLGRHDSAGLGQRHRPGGERYRYFGAFNGGAFQLAAAEEWMISSGSKVFWGPPSWLPADKFREIADQFTARPKAVIEPDALEPLLWTLPVVDMMKRVGMTYTTGKISCGTISPMRGGRSFLLQGIRDRRRALALHQFVGRFRGE